MVLLGDERVPEVHEHPTDTDDAVQPNHGLCDEQGHTDALEEWRDPPHVDDPGAELLAETLLEREQWQPDDQAQQEELQDEVGAEVDGQDGEAGDVEEADGAAEAGQHRAEAVGPLPQRTLRFWHVPISGAVTLPGTMKKRWSVSVGAFEALDDGKQLVETVEGTMGRM